MRRFWFTALFIVSPLSTSLASFDYNAKSDEELISLVDACTTTIQAESRGSFADIAESDVDDLDVTRTLFPKSASMMLLDIPKRDIKKKSVENLKKYCEKYELIFVFHGYSDSLVGMVDWVSVYGCHLKDGKVESVRKKNSIYIKQQ